MTANLPKQKHPFDDAGKVFVNKEWYLALLGIVSQINGGNGGVSVEDVQLLEAVDAAEGIDSSISKLLTDINEMVQLVVPQDALEAVLTRLKRIETLLAFMPEYPDSSSTRGTIFDEKGSGGTPGFAATADFTPGTTTSLTLSQSYQSAAHLWVTFDADVQGADQFTLSGRTLTFSSAIPVGVSKVFVKGIL
ncbi:hypothetical protein [Paraburkholderia rhynchosiae]|uniref:Uncharacterized protein n=1 Tax=Paraburkholderia rhynchosiae TaxID=487049 RepID=A0A2N7W9C5_9BURK|nr:hypothetical protein [Paraburkholderia rhynchosiae]PMS26008.1 hypothetical protein C0Z16_28145 [Paraburkholderia rhynchosiae]CAB3731133.1 hypothetical protein LMG27174_05808 [Paraburkholderia rhynchosiae]